MNNTHPQGFAKVTSVQVAVREAADAMLTQEEVDALFPERRKQDRTEKWTRAERFYKVPLLKLRGAL
jgi:hypothetical protein